MGNPIRIRRTLHDVPVDPPSVGEPFLHMLDNKFGIWNGTAMLWYPCVDPLTKMMYMNLGQKLSGKASDGSSTVYIDFDTPNAIRFLDSTGTVLAQFDATGASFNNPQMTDPVGGGTLNRFIHPGFIPNVFSPTAMTRNGPGKTWLGPNTLLWIAGTGSGVVSAMQSYMAGSSLHTHITSEKFTLTVNVTTQLGNGGLRMWVMDPNTGYFGDNTKNKNRIYVSVKGELNKLAYLRIGKNGTFTVKAITGSGAWKREYIDIPQHSYLADFAQGGTNAPYSLDVLWNAEAGVWGVAEPTMQCLDNFGEEIYQYRSLTDRLNAANMIWYEPVGYRMYGMEREYVNLPIPMPVYTEGFYMYSVDSVVAPLYPVTIDQKSRKGFEVHTQNENTAYWKYQPRVIVHGQISDIA